MSDVIGKAETFLKRGDVQGAANFLKQAEEGGDALAARELASWCLSGQYVRRDLCASRSFFERAAELGDHYSKEVTRAFVAGGVGGPADWGRAMLLLRGAATNDPRAAAQLTLIQQMQLDPSGQPRGAFAREIVCEDPSVILFRGLFTEAECAYLVDVGTPALRPSVIVDPATGRQIPNPIRTSTAMAFPFVDENPAVHALNRRLAAASGTDVRQGEPLQVLRYAPGEQYRQHSDALPGVAPSQQRVLTFLVYLNEDYEGGETEFSQLGLKIRGHMGDGLLFRSASADGTPDPRSVHAGLPVTSGAKYLASRWIRAALLVLE